MAHIHVTDETDADAELIDAARDAVDAAHDIEQAGGRAAIHEPAPGATEIAASGRPRIARAWVGAWPFVKLGLLGAAFVGGGMALARLAGPRTAHDLGERGGEGFAEGVLTAQRRMAALVPRVAVAGVHAAPVVFAHRGQRWR